MIVIVSGKNDLLVMSEYGEGGATKQAKQSNGQRTILSYSPRIRGVLRQLASPQLISDHLHLRVKGPRTSILRNTDRRRFHRRA